MKLSLVSSILALCAGCASTPALSPVAARVRVSTAAPPLGMVPVGRLRAVHGDGCGFAGGLGNHDGAENRMQTLAAKIGADYVQVTSSSEPHVEGECRRNEYVLEGQAYRSGSAASANVT